MKFKDHLKQARQKKGLTQKEASRLSGSTLRSIQQYEQGRNIPPLYTFLQLMKLYSVDDYRYIIESLTLEDTQKI